MWMYQISIYRLYCIDVRKNLILNLKKVEISFEV